MTPTASRRGFFSRLAAAFLPAAAPSPSPAQEWPPAGPRKATARELAESLHEKLAAGANPDAEIVLWLFDPQTGNSYLGAARLGVAWAADAPAMILQATFSRSEHNPEAIGSQLP